MSPTESSSPPAATCFAGVVLLHLPPAAGVVAAGLGAFVLGLAVYPLLIAPLKRRLGRRPAGALYLVLTLGASPLRP